MLSATFPVSSSPISLSPQHLSLSSLSREGRSAEPFKISLMGSQAWCSPRVSEREKEEEDAGIGADRAQSGKASITNVGPVTSAGMLMYPNPYLPWLMTASLPTLSTLFLLYPAAAAPVTQSCAWRRCSTANTTSTLRKGTERDLRTIALRQRGTVQCFKMILERNWMK